MRIGLVQFSALEDKKENLEKAIAGIEKAKKQGAQIACLQELFLTKYFAETTLNTNFALAEKIPGPTTEKLSQAAKKNNIVLVGGSLFEKSNDKYYNTCPVFNTDGKLLGTYRKVHIPNDPHYWEKFYFSSGNEYPVFETELCKIGVGICYDQWFPEVSRILALKGAQIIFYPTAIGWTDSMKYAPEETSADYRWMEDQKSHGSANSVFIAGVNRVGKEEYIDFWGQSFISDPFRRYTARAKAGEMDTVIVAECDLNLIEKAKSWGFMQNRRPETYEEIGK